MTWCDMHPVNISLQRGSSPTKRRSGRGGTRRRTLAELDDDVTAVIMTTGADHLCPQHSARVARYLATR